MHTSSRCLSTLILMIAGSVARAQESPAPDQSTNSTEEHGVAAPTQIPEKPHAIEEGSFQIDGAIGDPFGSRRTLAIAGVNIRGGLIVDGSRNFRGGLDTARDAWRNLFDLNLSFDLDKM